MARLAGDRFGGAPEDVLVASTGVIGEPLDAAKFGTVMGELVTSAAPGGWQQVADGGWTLL